MTRFGPALGVMSSDRDTSNHLERHEFDHHRVAAATGIVHGQHHPAGEHTDDVAKLKGRAVGEADLNRRQLFVGIGTVIADEPRQVPHEEARSERAGEIGPLKRRVSVLMRGVDFPLLGDVVLGVGAPRRTPSARRSARRRRG